MGLCLISATQVHMVLSSPVKPPYLHWRLLLQPVPEISQPPEPPDPPDPPPPPLLTNQDIVTRLPPPTESPPSLPLVVTSASSSLHSFNIKSPHEFFLNRILEYSDVSPTCLLKKLKASTIAHPPELPVSQDPPPALHSPSSITVSASNGAVRCKLTKQSWFGHSENPNWYMGLGVSAHFILIIMSLGLLLKPLHLISSIPFSATSALHNYLTSTSANSICSDPSPLPRTLSPDSPQPQPQLLDHSHNIIPSIHFWPCWQFWKAHNLSIFDNKAISAQEVVTKAVFEARLRYQAQQLLSPHNKISPAPLSRPPSPTTYNCLVDAAWLSHSSACGMGWALCDPSQVHLHQGQSSQGFVSLAWQAEALSLKTALIAVLTHGIEALNVFSGSLSLVNLLSTDGSVNESKNVLLDIRHLSSRFSCISFHFICRLENKTADALAKSALSLVPMPLAG